jgi:hypothetical protein
MQNEKRSLLESIRHASGETQPQSWADAWDTTEAAGLYAPLPSGKYAALAKSGELGENRKGTPRYRVEFELLEGEHAGRRLGHEFYLTPAALPLSKRDLALLGIERPEQMGQSLRPVRMVLRVALRVDDDGTEYNLVRGIERATYAAPVRPVEALTEARQPMPEAPAPGGVVFDDAFPPSGGAYHE